MHGSTGIENNAGALTFIVSNRTVAIDVESSVSIGKTVGHCCHPVSNDWRCECHNRRVSGCRRHDLDVEVVHEKTEE